MELYLITNRVNGKCYVGMTQRGIHRRFREHCRGALKNPRTPLHCAIAKYGAEAFKITPIGRLSSRADLDMIERAEIKRRGTLAPNGYNVTPGGDGQTVGYKPTPEVNAKVGEAARRTWASYTPEQRAARGAAISAAKKGKPRKVAEDYVNPMKGRTRPEEFKQRVSEGMKRYCATLPEGEMARRPRKSGNVG